MTTTFVTEQKNTQGVISFELAIWEKEFWITSCLHSVPVKNPLYLFIHDTKMRFNLIRKLNPYRFSFHNEISFCNEMFFRRHVKPRCEFHFSETHSGTRPGGLKQKDWNKKPLRVLANNSGGGRSSVYERWNWDVPPPPNAVLRILANMHILYVDRSL